MLIFFWENCYSNRHETRTATRGIHYCFCGDGWRGIWSARVVGGSGAGASWLVLRNGGQYMRAECKPYFVSCTRRLCV